MKSFLLVLSIVLPFITYGQGIDSALLKSLTEKFYNTDSLAQKQHAYDELLQKFPENKPLGAAVNYDELRRVLAINYLVKGDSLKFIYYTADTKNKVFLAGWMYNIASHSTNPGPMLGKAELLARLAVQLNHKFYENTDKYKPKNITQGDWKIQLQQQTVNYAYTYARILYNQAKYKQALNYIQPVYKNLTAPNDEVSELFSLLLGVTGLHKEAIIVIERAIESGYRSNVLLDELKKDYMAIHGSETGYEHYFENLKDKIKTRVRERLTQSMINKPAPAFILKNANGKQVSLADYKGRIVVIDFWATWCGPCIKSFPAMQQAVKKYSASSAPVEFLFIDTWETAKDYQSAAKKIIADAKYQFNVLFDEPTVQGKQSRVADSFNVGGLPTKMVLDKKGNIRFIDIGYQSSTDKQLEDLDMMIELAEGKM